MKKRALVQVLCLAFAVVLGLFMIATRTSAQQPAKRGEGAKGGAAGAPSDAGAAASSDKKDDPKKDAKKDDKDKDDAKDAKKDDKDKDDQTVTAVVGPDGGVPIHADGPFRSPFANPTFGGVATIRVGLVLNDITQYSIQNGSFVADFYLSLTSDRPMPDMDLIFPNGNSVNKEVITDKPTFKFYRYNGTFLSPPNLRRYPFDEQELGIEIEENTEGIDEIRLVPDQKHTRLENGFEVTGWDVASLEARVGVHDYPDRFDNDDLYYSRYVFKLGISRYGTSAMFTVFVPAIVIVLISLMGMWVGPDHMEVRSNAGAPMLAGAVLFHFALMQQLPAVSYLTRADKLMMGVYLSLFVCMLSTWAFFLVDEEKQGRVFTLGRAIVPPLTAVIMVIACTA